MRIVSRETAGNSGKVARNCRTSASSPSSRARIVGQSPSISWGSAIGMPTCSSSEEARPSQKKCLPQARFHSDGVLRRSGAPESASARRRPSVNARSGLWQLAQARSPPPESRASANSRAPSAIFSGLSGLSGGEGGGVAGRLNICRHTASTSPPCPMDRSGAMPSSRHSAKEAATTRRGCARGMQDRPCGHAPAINPSISTALGLQDLVAPASPRAITIVPLAATW